MILEHQGNRPKIDESAYVAPNATVSGDVTIGEGTCILFGTVITADGGPVEIGCRCIVMENAVIRGTPRHPARLGDNVLVGPRAYLTGCLVEDDVFLATGSTVFNGARIGVRSEVRINGVVHLKTRLLPGTTVPIGWVAVGDPARIYPRKITTRSGRFSNHSTFRWKCSASSARRRVKATCPRLRAGIRAG